MDTRQVVEGFYNAFVAVDGEAMASHYHNQIAFEDPAFGKLNGDRAKYMWEMLLGSQKGKEFVVTYTIESINDNKAIVYWEAKYTFTPTGKKVHNKIYAHMQVKDGKIIKHEDRFNMHKWARQAMGLPGWILGGTSMFRKKLQAKTNENLSKYIAKQIQ